MQEKASAQKEWWSSLTFPGPVRRTGFSVIWPRRCWMVSKPVCFNSDSGKILFQYNYFHHKEIIEKYGMGPLKVSVMKCRSLIIQILFFFGFSIFPLLYIFYVACDSAAELGVHHLSIYTTYWWIVANLEFSMVIPLMTFRDQTKIFICTKVTSYALREAPLLSY